MPLKQLAKDQSTGMHLEGTHAIPTARHQQVWGGCMRSREGQHLHVTQSIFVHKHLGKDFVRSASTNELRTHVMTGVAMLPWETLRASSNRRLSARGREHVLARAMAAAAGHKAATLWAPG
jgi:hypothetical protein